MHTHTCCSDGQLTPAALVDKARAVGLHALAITDHDCIDGLVEGAEAAQQTGLTFVSGVELSVTVGDKEVHLLGYFFDPAHPGLGEHLAAFQKARQERAVQIVARLQALGIPLAFEAVQAQAHGEAIARTHIALALVEGGHVPTYGDAFEWYLQDNGPAFVPKPQYPAREALALLHDAGGIGVLAHPGHWTSDATLHTLIHAGLDGIETIHPAHDDMLTQYYRQIARDFVLLETGGSDYHGSRPDDDGNLGKYTIPYPRLERARRAAQALGVS